MTNLKKWLQYWDFGLCIIFTMWMTSPLWMHGQILFMGKPSADNVVTPWFYDFIARSLWDGSSYEYLREFDFPNPQHYTLEFPSVMDAVLLAPIAWIFDWPQQWAWALTATMLINAVAVASFAKVIGLGRWGVAFSGMSVVLLRPLWAEMVKGRMNVLMPGLAILAMVGVLLCFRRDSNNQKRTPFIRGFGVLLSFSMGVIGALVYPPFLLMFIPIGLLVVFPFWKNSGFLSVLLPIAIAGLAYWSIFDTLWGIYYDNHRVLDCANLNCPDRYNSFAVSSLALWEPIERHGLSLSGLQAAGWLLPPFVLLHPKFRWKGLGFGIVALGYVFMSLGPCPNATPFERMKAQWIEDIMPWMNSLWCASAHLHDFGRFGMVTGFILCICSGISLDVLWRFRSRILKLVSIAIGSWILWLSYEPLLQEILNPSKWHAIPRNVISDFMKDRPRRAIAELPFDRSAQFLSGLSAPYVWRVNPIRPNDPPRAQTTFYTWLYAVAKGQKPDLTPTAEDVRRSGLSWIFFDPSRCEQHGGKVQPCAPWVREELKDVLGEPEMLSFGVSVWEID